MRAQERLSVCVGSSEPSPMLKVSKSHVLAHKIKLLIIRN